MPSTLHVWSNRHLVEALDAYFAHRLQKRLRVGEPDRYRGLVPNSKLVLTLKGQKFYMNTKRRWNEAGAQDDYLASDGLQAHVTRLYKDAGIKGRLKPFWSAHNGIAAAGRWC